ncbi:aspartyl-tRNA(Asn)/glutamyl-tRNA (Gln) amidotransferase subunit B [Deferribacter desulfuricans SSM1]|uniref:Aspartyl/glutamyl-tRNA(Asn/Gln) amidotransferase subunit B n=1 Tax=Deferribacter desulfuricans (strain DSM 14783 / JCM 11476 / NBRC 101012 / SSM1) TaxID=639282 RepID=D3P9J5_DEFDS|nr:Asp-tRNA(Asn)/Glu-tRNA(Gln) amidotransferase subunit GatB [Deferribacter desulfuricans]BAI81385.1 aspartyl-tRNA(Asn)/glutamyl-tRNA (Gln) amidotransferase subunit B [Deferribacter desulfuricans SSM1]
MKYEAVIGLEVHVQLSTKSKIFCSCSTEFGADPNTHVCPVCLGMPGVLPVLNKQVVEYTIKAGLALNCDIQRKSVFARKNYFYPDLPKGYQISQYELPICLNGFIEIEIDGVKKKIGITRIHMEEDAGKSIHGENLGSPAHSYVDLNRTGVPLIEIVSEPDIRTPEEARAYLQKLKTILEYIEVSDCNMEEGSLRCDANISLRPVGETKFGTKTEIKNMNSFRNVQRAIEFEIKRQAKILDEGGTIVQETRLWDPNKGITVSMRSKEEAHDYRYFPDPDLVPLIVENDWIEKVKSTLPELPDAKKERFMKEYGLPSYDAEVLISNKHYADYFEQSVKNHNNPKAISNWIMSEVLRDVNEKGCNIFELNVKPEHIAEIVKLIDDGKISGKIGKEVYQLVLESGKSPAKIVEEKGLIQISDESAIEEIVKKVLEANPKEVERYKNGEKKLQGFFVGQVMKETKGKANPKLVNQLLQKLLS